MDTELLQRYIAGDATEAEQKQVMEWMDESPEHLHEYMAQRKLHDVMLWHDEEKTEKHHIHYFSWRKPVLNFLKIAAMIVLILWGSYYLWGQHEQTETFQSIYVPEGQRAELSLADGTKVWLNSRSRLTFPGTFDGKTRNVKLDGEGYFVVKADKSHPFIVNTDKGDIRVLGTEFNVIAYASDSIWETSLLKGKVEILAQGFSMELTPDTKVRLEGNKFVKLPVGEKDYFRWKEGLICFHDISLENMLKKFELYYGVKIVVNNRSILRNRYTGKFRTNDGIEHVLRVLNLNCNFTYTRDDDANVITIN